MNHTLNPDGKTFKMEGLLDANFSGMTSAPVECLVTERNNSAKLLLSQTYKTVDVWCRYNYADPFEDCPCNLNLFAWLQW